MAAATNTGETSGDMEIKNTIGHQGISCKRIKKRRKLRIRNKTMKLISEEVQEVEYITEEKEGGKTNYKIRGIFMQADIKNRNGRVYPMEVLNKEVARYNKEYIKENRAFGELGHPRWANSQS